MMLISHDRAIIDACCNKLLILDGDGNHEVFDGNYSAWAQELAERESRKADRDADSKRQREQEEKRQRAQAEKKQQEQKAQQAQQGQKKPQQRSQSSMSLMSQGKLESEIERIEKRIEQIDKEMALPDVWSDHRKMTKLGDERAKLAADLEPLEFEWMSRAGD